MMTSTLTRLPFREAVAVFLVLMSTAGCALTRTSILRTSPPPLCMKQTVIVTGPWKDRVTGVFQKLFASAKGDLGTLRVEAVAVRSTAATEDSDEGFAVCRAPDRATITMSHTRLTRLLGRPDGDVVLARTFAHLLAHLALHPRPPAPGEPHARAEAEADELGVFYFERAGYDCTRWEDPGEYRPNIRVACNLAKQGFALHRPGASQQAR